MNLSLDGYIEAQVAVFLGPCEPELVDVRRFETGVPALRYAAPAAADE
jgi:hypothetical protein